MSDQQRSRRPGVVNSWTSGQATAHPEHTPSAASPTEPSTPESSADLSPLVRTALRGNAIRSYWIGLVIGVVLAVATALLVVQNSQSARVEWLGWDFLAPLWLILLLSVAAGAVLLALSAVIIAHARARNASGKTARKRLQRLAAQSGQPGAHRAPDSTPPG